MALYGDAREPNNTIGAATDIGFLGNNQVINLSTPAAMPYAPPPANISSTAIDNAADVDLFRFNLSQGGSLYLVVSPQGFPVRAGSAAGQPEPGSAPALYGDAMNSGTAATLRAEILDSSGVVLATAGRPPSPASR